MTTFDTMLKDTELPMRAVNALSGEGIKNMRDLDNYIRTEIARSSTPTKRIWVLKRIPNIGHLSATSILNELDNLNDQHDDFIDWCINNRTILEKLRKLKP